MVWSRTVSTDWQSSPIAIFVPGELLFIVIWRGRIISDYSTSSTLFAPFLSQLFSTVLDAGAWTPVTMATRLGSREKSRWALGAGSECSAGCRGEGVQFVSSQESCVTDACDKVLWNLQYDVHNCKKSGHVSLLWVFWRFRCVVTAFRYFFREYHFRGGANWLWQTVKL